MLTKFRSFNRLMFLRKINLGEFVRVGLIEQPVPEEALGSGVGLPQHEKTRRDQRMGDPRQSGADSGAEDER